MLKTSGNGTQASGATKFTLRPTAETLADLSHPIDPRHLKTRKQGTTTLTYCPWNTIARHLPPSDPLSAPLGQVFALGDQTLMDRTGEHRHAVPAHLVAEVPAGDARAIAMHCNYKDPAMNKVRNEQRYFNWAINMQVTQS